jgi:hypothetical protein
MGVGPAHSVERYSEHRGGDRNSAKSALGSRACSAIWWHNRTAHRGNEYVGSNVLWWTTRTTGRSGAAQ